MVCRKIHPKINSIYLKSQKPVKPLQRLTKYQARKTPKADETNEIAEKFIMIHENGADENNPKLK